MKHSPRQVMTVAVVSLVLAAGVGLLAFLLREEPGSPSAGATPTTSVSSSAPSPSAPGAPRHRVRVVPGPIVDPLTSNDYCGTVRLLVTWSHQPYGLDTRLKAVDGTKFARRLQVASAAYRKLSVLARTRSGVSGTVPAWAALSTSVTAARNALLQSGQDVHSQLAMVELAKMADVTRTQLPKATEGLQATCGIAPAELENP